ncbi:MAG: DUF1573 domain-containing protein [Flavobacteriia bacterium]
MKILTLILVSSFFYACSGNDTLEMGQKTSLKVNPVFNAGKVLHGEMIDASFDVTNDGDYPLVISEVKGSCSCTVVDKPEKPIPPGETVKIKASVKTENASAGNLSKEVRIIANTEPSLTVLKINAVVYRK